LLLVLLACGDSQEEESARDNASDVCSAALRERLGANANAITTFTRQVEDGLYELTGEASPEGAGSSPTTRFVCTAEATSSRAGVRSLTLDP